MRRVNLLIALVLCSASTGFGLIMTNTGFPWEGCKQVTDTAGFNMTLQSYTESATGSEICYKIQATDVDKCEQAQQKYKIKTRCCTMKLNKLKFWPAQNCTRAYRTITFKPKNAPAFTKSWSIQTMPAPAVKAYTLPGETTPPGAYWVIKSTALDLTREVADGMTVCVTLGNPCPNLKSFAYGGKVLEWLLYDAKQNNYECCVPGITPVPGASNSSMA